MNIVGENFPEFVKKQVEQRELFYGKKERDPQTLVYLNSNISWIKLGSSVNIDPNSQKYKDLEIPEGFGGAELAKRAVLFNGTSFQDTQFSGISRENSILNNSVYGFGGNQFGLSPMPGITSITTKYKNRGSLRRGTVSLVAHNTKQFEIIELLYLRLGYTVLLEFGHSLYINDEGQVESMGPTLMNDFLEGKFKNNNEVLQAILKKRDDYRGNYDALLARVINFSWSLQSNGTYEITIELSSIGDVIDSIKMNTKSSINLVKKENVDQQEETKGRFSEQLINTNSETSELARIFSEKIRELKSKLYPSFIIGKDIDSTQNQEQEIINYFAGFSLSDNKDNLKNTKEYLYYIRFGELLRLIEDNTIFSVNEFPYIEFDKDIKTNLILTDTYNFEKTGEFFQTFSTDPRKVRVDTIFSFLKEDKTQEGKTLNSITSKLIYPLGDFHEKIGNSQVGRLMNVYLEMGFILQLFLELVDENGDVSLNKFLEKICENINSSLGHLNKIEPTIDDTINKIVFRDQTPLPNRDSVLKNILPNYFSLPTVFNIYSYSDNKAGFVQDFSFTTQLSNNFATLTTIGAQAKGEVVGEDATAFSNWNQGLTDRLNVTKNNPLRYPQPSFNNVTNSFIEYYSLDETELKIKEAILKVYGDYSFGVRDFTSNTDLSIILKNYIKENRKKRLENLQSQENNTKTVNTSGFLPLNLSLKLNGLSGFKIYQKFNINQRILPRNYTRNLEFIIKGITNTVNEGGWVTEIETFTTVPPDFLLPGGNPSSQNQQPSSKAFNPGTGNGSVRLTQNGREITQENLLSQLNSSSEIQRRFRSFLNTISSTLPGYTLQINSVYRTFKEQAQEKVDNEKNASAGTSTHNYGVAIDFNLITPNGTTLRKAGPKENWVSTGIVDDALINGIKWGGNFPNYVDCVHFYVDIDQKAALERAKSEFNVVDINIPREAEKINGKLLNVNDLIIG